MTTDIPTLFDLITPDLAMKLADAALLSRAQGCWLGQLAGDALGSLVEFKSVAVIARDYPNGVRLLADGGTWNTVAGQPTDDSELALMLARTLAKLGRYDDDAVAAGYAHWYTSRPFDCGTTTRRALSIASRAAENHAANTRNVANATSQANGALMRVSPLGIFGHALPSKTLADLARRDATITHPHAVCQHANAVFVTTIAYAIRTGAVARDIYCFALDFAKREKLDDAVISRIECAQLANVQDFSSQMGWVLIALQNAFYQLLHAKNLEDGIVNTIMQGGDTDTNACIAGALLGAVHGIQSVPKQWLDKLLNCMPVAGMLNVRHPRPREFWPIDCLDLAERLAFLGQKFASQSEYKQ